MSATVLDLRSAFTAKRLANARSEAKKQPSQLAKELARAAFKDAWKGKQGDLPDQPEPPRAA